MTEPEASDVVEIPERTAVTVSWPQAFGTYIPLAVVLGLGAVFAIIVMVPLAFVLVWGAIPYTLTATFFILRGRRAARHALDAIHDLPVEMGAANFGARAQKLSLLNGTMLGLLGILLLPSMRLVSPPPGSTMVILALIAMFSAVEIVVNAGWIYGRRTVLAEEYALRTRTHSWKLILANRWLGWLIWYTGAGIAGFALLTQPGNFLP
jgi:hypothetical protein